MTLLEKGWQQMISPEEIAKICLNDKNVNTEDKTVLFFKEAIVVVFDGLIIWRGSLNMHAAVERLKILAKAVGLPIAVIEGSELKSTRKKKQKPGKFIGPKYWDSDRAWDSINGLDPFFWPEYDKDCKLAKTPDIKTGGWSTDWDETSSIYDSMFD